MFEIKQKVDKKEFIKCNTYFLRKFFGLKETIMLLLLLMAGLILFLVYSNALMLIMFVIVCLSILLALAFYFVTVNKGWKLEFEKAGIKEQILLFKGEILRVTSLNDLGETVNEDEYEIKNVDKVAFRKGKIYYFQGVATMFYIYPDAFLQGDYEKLREKLATTLDINKFKMKTRRKTFPRPIVK